MLSTMSRRENHLFRPWQNAQLLASLSPRWLFEWGSPGVTCRGNCSGRVDSPSILAPGAHPWHCTPEQMCPGRRCRGVQVNGKSLKPENIQKCAAYLPSVAPWENKDRSLSAKKLRQIEVDRVLVDIRLSIS